MGMMKEFLIEKVAEYCRINNLNEANLFKDKDLYDKAVDYADKKLKEGKICASTTGK